MPWVYDPRSGGTKIAPTLTSHVEVQLASKLISTIFIGLALGSPLKKLNLSPEKALQHLDTMYKVYMRDKKKKFKISRIVTLTKIQKDILRAVDKKLLNPAA